MKQHDAEIIAVKALAWIAESDQIASGFMGMAGATPDDLRTRASDPEFLGFVLDYVLSQDEFVLEFSQAAGISPQTPMTARAYLPGGDLPNWT